MSTCKTPRCRRTGEQKDLKASKNYEIVNRELVNQ